jgi:von Willebrand factor type A domain
MNRSWWFGVPGNLGLNMKLIQLIAVPIALAVLCGSATPASAADEDGVAVAIVYDTSGSMNSPVKDKAGKSTPKYIIANRALVAIANRIQTFATNSAAGSPRKIHAGLFVFRKDGPHTALPFGPFNAAAFTTWARDFSAPGGGTPLGNTLNTAGHAVLNSGLTRKHVLVITDGMNTIGPDPAPMLAKLQQEAGQKQTSVSVHFVAFDVDAKVFEGVKKLGATVVGASNESQLNTQLEFILEKKILLEEEEPPKQK